MGVFLPLKSSVLWEGWQGAEQAAVLAEGSQVAQPALAEDGERGRGVTASSGEEFMSGS